MWFYAGTNTQRMCDTNSPKQMLKHRMMCDIMWHHKNACGVKNFHNNLHHSPPASLWLRWDDINEDFRCLQLCKDTRREIKIKPETPSKWPSKWLTISLNVSFVILETTQRKHFYSILSFVCSSLIPRATLLNPFKILQQFLIVAFILKGAPDVYVKAS